MKTTTLMTLGALAATCTFATAQDKPRKERAQRQIPPELLKMFDKDGDGKLSPDERKAMMDARKEMETKRHEAMMAKFDKDGDGKLSDEERTAMRAAMEAKRKELLEKYDADKNGKLDPAEIKAAHDAGEEIPMGGGMRRPGDKGMKRGGDHAAPADAPPAGE